MYNSEITGYRMCPSCGTTCFFPALSGNKIIFHVSENNDLMVLPDQTFDEIRLYINPWRIYCDACAWSGPIHDLILAEV
jgi:hypothetical protein